MDIIGFNEFFSVARCLVLLLSFLLLVCNLWIGWKNGETHG